MFLAICVLLRSRLCGELAQSHRTSSKVGVGVGGLVYSVKCCRDLVWGRLWSPWYVAAGGPLPAQVEGVVS